MVTAATVLIGDRTAVRDKIRERARAAEILGGFIPRDEIS